MEREENFGLRTSDFGLSFNLAQNFQNDKINDWLW